MEDLILAAVACLLVVAMIFLGLHRNHVEVQCCAVCDWQEYDDCELVGGQLWGLTVEDDCWCYNRVKPE